MLLLLDLPLVPVFVAVASPLPVAKKASSYPRTAGSAFAASDCPVALPVFLTATILP